MDIDFCAVKSGDDMRRILLKGNVQSKVIQSTQAWVDKFVIGYKLCPFAERVFKQGTVRYRVHLGSTEDKIIERIKYEVMSRIAICCLNTMVLVDFFSNNIL